jgi:hydroxymethylglutaryl-CoA lyase
MKGGKVSIVEVGLRDGLQNESINLPVVTRIAIAQRLAEAGVRRMEIGAFVRSDKVFQMAGTTEVIAGVSRLQKENKIPKNVRFSALVPNEIGLQAALETKVQELAVFCSASESFSLKNINCTVEESFKRFIPIMTQAKKLKLPVRGYLSTCFGCPYEGQVSEERVVNLAARLVKIGCYEVSIADTIGIANPGQVESLFRKLKRKIPVKKLAGHFHDTRGTALANILTAYNLGVRVFDSSLGGLGGCPYAPGASGNVATEDVVYMFEGMKIKTGLNLSMLIELNHWLANEMGRDLPSRVSKANLFKPLGKVTSSQIRRI